MHEGQRGLRSRLADVAAVAYSCRSQRRGYEFRFLFSPGFLPNRLFSRSVR